MTAALPSTRLHRGWWSLIQALVVALGWIGFVLMWLLVAQQRWEFARLVWLIGGSTVVLPLFTLAWVAHNRALYRRKGERKGLLRAVPAYTHDWHGRTIEADWPVLRQSQLVTISVADGHKRYRGRTLVAPGPGRVLDAPPPADLRPRARRPVVPAADARAVPDLLAAGAGESA